VQEVSIGIKLTHVRHQVIGMTMVMAFILYLDRICMGEIVKSVSFNSDLKLTEMEIGRVLSAFFFAYALFQLPAGWASDRFGARPMLTIYILLWSFFTILTGCVTSAVGLIFARILCGAAEAGAYPTSMALIRKWYPVTSRGVASAMVSLGGRVGGTLAPILTIWLIVRLGNWRATLWINGVLGFVVAYFFWRFVRSSPQQHPAVNEAEFDHIGSNQEEPGLTLPEVGGAIWSFTKSISIWCLSISQLLQNVGWGFLVTWLPTYLVKAQGVGEIEGGTMLTIILGCGILGQLAGGYYCDWTTRWLGVRLGRLIPMVTSMAVCALAYAVCPFVQSTWLLVLCCAIVSFSTDVGNPALWAFAGDAGGRATALLGGWMNMWGNFGASAGALLIPWLMSMGDGEGKTRIFLSLSGAFVLAGVLCLPMNATKLLVTNRS